MASPNQSLNFQDQYNAAKTSTAPTRNLEVAARIEVLEREMELLCITGVEDKWVCRPKVAFTLRQITLRKMVVCLLKITFLFLKWPSLRFTLCVDAPLIVQLVLRWASLAFIFIMWRNFLWTNQTAFLLHRWLEFSLRTLRTMKLIFFQTSSWCPRDSGSHKKCRN